jgi:hypothetical protein
MRSGALAGGGSSQRSSRCNRLQRTLAPSIVPRNSWPGAIATLLLETQLIHSAPPVW